MTHCTTATEAKRGLPSPKARHIPREGTKIRALYDLFWESRGKGIKLTTNRNGNSVRIECLRNFYGLDIRRVRNGWWVLAGEWVGRVYVDYVAKRAEESAMMKPPNNFPPPDTKRWIPPRKAAVVRAVQSGAFSRTDALRYYALSEEEFSTWERNYDRDGAPGLYVTKGKP